MKPAFKYFSLIFIVAFVSGLIIYACSNDDDKSMIKDFKESFMDFIEGRDENALLRYVPDEMSDFEITMDSGRSRFVPESLDDLEMVFDDIAYEFHGDSVSVIQGNEACEADSAVLIYTIKIVDGYMERTLPVRIELARDESQGKWVMIRLVLYN